MSLQGIAWKLVKQPTAPGMAPIYRVALRCVKTTNQVWCLQPRSANLEFKSFKLSMVRCSKTGCLMICSNLISPSFSNALTIPRGESFLWNGGWTTVSPTLIMPWRRFSHLARKCSNASLYTWSLKTRTAKSHISRQIGKSNLMFNRHSSIFTKQMFLLRHAPQMLGRFLRKAFCIRRCPLSPSSVAPLPPKMHC